MDTAALNGRRSDRLDPTLSILLSTVSPTPSRLNQLNAWHGNRGNRGTWKSSISAVWEASGDTSSISAVWEASAFAQLSADGEPDRPAPPRALRKLRPPAANQSDRDCAGPVVPLPEAHYPTSLASHRPSPSPPRQPNTPPILAPTSTTNRLLRDLCVSLSRPIRKTPPRAVPKTTSKDHLPFPQFPFLHLCHQCNPWPLLNSAIRTPFTHPPQHPTNPSPQSSKLKAHCSSLTAHSPSPEGWPKKPLISIQKSVQCTIDTYVHILHPHNHGAALQPTPKTAVPRIPMSVD